MTEHADARTAPGAGAPPAERRHERRPWWTHIADPIYKGLRLGIQRVHSVRAAVGIVLIAGLAVATAAIAGFAAIADAVTEGSTQALDEGVMALLGEHRIQWIERSLLEITALGTGLVVLVVVGVAALLLWNTRHRYSAVLLLVSASGGIVINNVLKLIFARERPQVFEWVTHASSASFPSGHAMSAAIVYATVAYLAARLQKNWWARTLTLLAAGVLITLIAISRMYLGVHYPSDVLAGILIGLAWAAFCMAMLEAIQRLGRRRAEVRRDERPAAEEG